MTTGSITGPELRFFRRESGETIDAMYPVAFIEDFLLPTATIPAAGSPVFGTRWVARNVGTGVTVAIENGTTNGTLNCALNATSEKQDAAVYMNDQRVFSLEQGLIYEARVRLQTVPTGGGSGSQIFWGLAGNWADGPDNINFSCWFAAKGNGEILCELDDSVTDFSTTSGVTVNAADYNLYRIDATDKNNIQFFINGNRVAAGTTFAYASNANLQPYISAYKASGTSIGRIVTDFVKVWQRRNP